MQAIATNNAVHYRLREIHKSFPVLPTPIQGKILVELPVVDDTNEAGLFIGTNVKRSLMQISNQFLIVKGHEGLNVDPYTVIQCNESALTDVMSFADDEGLDRRFAYVKADFVSGTIPAKLSAFHEPLTETDGSI